MSPRPSGKIDVSTGWPVCGSCPHKHMPGSACPPSEVWLVPVLCGKCKPRTGAYCRFHSGHVQPVPDDAHALAPGPVDDVRRRAAGDGADG